MKMRYIKCMHLYLYGKILKLTVTRMSTVLWVKDHETQHVLISLFQALSP